LPSRLACREVVDELGCGDEERVETLLQRAVGDGDGKVSLAASGLAFEDDRAPLGDESGESSEPIVVSLSVDCSLKSYSSMVRKKGNAAAPSSRSEAGAAAMRDFLGKQSKEQPFVGPVFLLCALDEVAPDAASVGETEALVSSRVVRW
jgi:hypothetical protein